MTERSSHLCQLLAAEFLDTLGRADEGERLHGLHSPDAILRHHARLVHAAGVDPAAFARSHHERWHAEGDALPVYTAPTTIQFDHLAANDDAVAWYATREQRDDRHLMLAMGFRRTGSDLRIGWATLAPQPLPWSFEQGRLHSLAEFPWMRLSHASGARVLLDASYFRQHRSEPVKFIPLPDARFGCQMSTVCCKHDFEIALPPEAQWVIDAMPWPAIAPKLEGTRLPVRPDGQLQLKSLNETCRFLGPQRQCHIHSTLGRQPFGPCAVFPFGFARTPDGITVSMSPICGSARLGLGTPPAERDADLRERLALTVPRQTDTYRLAPGREIPWEAFRDIESALQDCLTSHDLPLRRRLHVGSRLLGALRGGSPIQTEAWIAEPLEQISDELRQALSGTIANILKWDRAALRSLQPPSSHAPAIEFPEPDALVRILQNTLHSKVYSYPYDLTTSHNLMIVLYQVALLMQRQADGPLPEVWWRELGALGVHGLLAHLLDRQAPDGFRALLGTSEFGRWMLAL